ncbi:TnsA-like heteromeric transposase endonuclease subunit [Streptomyces cavernae]|uniref:TnsA-like heteromeric transposase endonuclease subunit n=1 Tax=Streptomyces cavernae TaxID=2259034 RepID=UPI000FEC0785|nr:TnsA-like heteromeric transposase endonuclease subunit [Streptomyces cavernae]
MRRTWGSTRRKTSSAATREIGGPSLPRSLSSASKKSRVLPRRACQGPARGDPGQPTYRAATTTEDETPPPRTHTTKSHPIGVEPNPIADHETPPAPHSIKTNQVAPKLTARLAPKSPVENKPKDAEAFEVTRLACVQAGWDFERIGEPDRVMLANVRWLSRYRHPRCWNASVALRLRESFRSARSLMAGADATGDRLVTLPVLFHLMWRQELVTEGLAVELLGPWTIARIPAPASCSSTRSTTSRRGLRPAPKSPTP